MPIAHCPTSKGQGFEQNPNYNNKFVALKADTTNTYHLQSQKHETKNNR
jgi:hypothetical protein